MKTKNFLAFSASVVAGTSASADVQYTKLSETLTTNVHEEGLRFNLRSGTASKDPISTDEVSEFRLKFDLDSSMKPLIQSLGEEDGVFTFESQTTAARLAENDLISDSGNYRQTEFTSLVSELWEAGSGPGYLGLRFHESEIYYYGWAKIEYTADRELSLYSFAYEDDGSAIRAGEIPEPKTSALLAALAAGSAVIYCRRKKMVSKA